MWLTPPPEPNKDFLNGDLTVSVRRTLSWIYGFTPHTHGPCNKLNKLGERPRRSNSRGTGPLANSLYLGQIFFKTYLSTFVATPDPFQQITARFRIKMMLVT